MDTKTETEIENLREEIETIKTRNRRVEADKAWETSWTRRAFIAITTYLVVVVFFFSIGNQQPFATAIVPAVAYLLSTFSVGILKSWWLKRKGSA